LLRLVVMLLNTPYDFAAIALILDFRSKVDCYMGAETY